MDEPLVKGSLDHTSMEEVMGVVCLSRQCFEIRVEDDSPVGGGALIVKAGHLLGAYTDHGHHGIEAFHQLIREPGERFSVAIVACPPHAASIGALPDLLPRSPRPSAPPTIPRPDPSPTTRVLQGSFSDYSLADLVDVISLSRQGMSIRFVDGVDEAFVLVKAGQVIHVYGWNGTTGDRGIRSIREHPGQSFRVDRHAEVIPDPKIIGHLEDLLKDVTEEPTSPLRTVVVDGRVPPFAFEDVLRVMSITRQRMVFELWGTGRRLGQAAVKAGQILDAETSEGHHGVEALQHLASLPQADRFVLAREPSLVDEVPIATILDAFGPGWASPTAPPSDAGDAPKISQGAAPANLPARPPREPDPADMVSEEFALDLTDEDHPLDFDALLFEADASDTEAPLVFGAPAGTDAEAPPVFEAPAGTDAVAPLVVEALHGDPEDEISGEGGAISNTDAPVVFEVGPPTHEGPQLLLEGAFANFQVKDVLGMLSLSRHCLELTVSRPGEPNASLLVKSGKILGAEAGAADASFHLLSTILTQQWAQFSVTRRTVPETLFPVAELITVANQILGPTGSAAFRQPPAPAWPATPGHPIGAARPAPAALQGLEDVLAELRSAMGNRRAEQDLTTALSRVSALEQRIEAQDRLVRSRSSAIHDNRGLTFMALALQLLIAAALVLVNLSGWLWNN